MPPKSAGDTKSATDEEHALDLGVLALSNILSANVDVGLKHYLTLGYHENPALRTAFMQIMRTTLQQGTRFGGLGTRRGTMAPKALLQALAAPNLALAIAICEVCPSNEVDEMLVLLFRAFEARSSLLALMKVLIEKEVAQTSELHLFERIKFDA
jgi:neurofibromin 1